MPVFRGRNQLVLLIEILSKQVHKCFGDSVELCSFGLLYTWGVEGSPLQNEIYSLVYRGPVANWTNVFSPYSLLW